MATSTNIFGKEIASMRTDASRQPHRVAAYACTIFMALALCLCLSSCSKEESTEIKDSVEDFEGTSVAVITGSAQQDMAETLWDSIEIKGFNSFADAAAAVSAGKAACGIAPRSSIDDAIAPYDNLVYVDESLGTVNGSFIFKKDSKDTLLYKQVDEFINKIKADGTLAEITAIWKGNDESKKVLPPMEELTGENGTLNLVTSASEVPYEYYKDNQIVGIDPDIVYRFCKEYGYTFTLEDVPLTSLFISVNSGKYDFSPALLIMTDERAQQVDFSAPITETYNVLYYSTDGGNGGSLISSGGISESFEKTFLRESRWQLILSGLGVTLLVTVLAAIFGTALGFGLALARYSCKKAVNKVIDIYVRIFQGTPVLVMLLIFYYVVFGSVEISSILVAVAVFALNSAAFISEALYSNIKAVDPGQREAAIASGFTEWEAFKRFILPIAIRRVLPVYRGEILGLLKGTSIVGYVAIVDLTKAGDIIRSRTYEALFPLLAVALIYLAMGWVISILLKKIEKRLTVRLDRVKGVDMRDPVTQPKTEEVSS